MRTKRQPLGDEDRARIFLKRLEFVSPQLARVYDGYRVDIDELVQLANYWFKRERSWASQGILFNGFPMCFEYFMICMQGQNLRCANPRCDYQFLKLEDPTAHADHDHRTRDFRGVLCMDCNQIEGRLRVERRLQNMTPQEREWFSTWESSGGNPVFYRNVK
jgi:hypothetical protein